MQSTRTSDEAEKKEKLELRIIIPDEESSSSSNDAERSQDESESSHSDIESASDAFKILMNESVLFALNKDYTKSMNFLRAIGDAFCEQEKFSWVKSGKLTGALAIGAFASIFVATTTGQAATTLTNAFKQQTGIDISYGQIVVRIFQVANVSGSAALATYSGLNLIETYLGRTSAAEKYLKFEAGTCQEISKKIGRKVFDLLCAIASSVPTFFFTESTSIPLAVFTAAANTAINWLGVSSVPLTPSHIHPARRVEITYLNEQLEAFLKLPAKRQQTIITDISGLQKKKMHDCDYKQLYARLLNLGKPDPAATDPADEIRIQDEEIPSCPKKAFAIALGTYMTITQIAFTEATYAGISRLFQDTASPPAIASGSISALFSLLPNIGFGFFSGYNAANTFTSHNTPLAKMYLSKTREAIKCVIGILSLFCGGTSFTIAMNADTDLTNLANIQDGLKTTLDVLTGTISYSTGVMITAYYTLKLCDEILIFLTQRCADEDTRRLFTFVLETRRMNKIISESTEDNYLALLRWKMTNCKESSSLLHALFKERLSVKEYLRVQTDVNQSAIIIRDRDKVPDYKTSESFVKDTPEWKLQHPGLRRRKCVVVCCDAQESDDTSSTPTSSPTPSLQI